MREDAQLIRSSAIALPVLLTTITTADTHIDILLDHLLDHVNLVRSRTSSWRYPLTRDSTEICHIKGKTNVQLTMMELARLGKAFDPNSRPDTLIPITANQLNDEEVDNLNDEDEAFEEESELENDNDDENENENDSVTFKFYTRCTASLPILQLVDQLTMLEKAYPNYHVWVHTQFQDLREMYLSGHTHARLFYHGQTSRQSIKDRTAQTKQKWALVETWQKITGVKLLVYHWKDLDVVAPSEYAFRTDESIAGIEEFILDVAGGTHLNFNQQPGGFAHRISYHPSLVSIQRQLASNQLGIIQQQAPELDPDLVARQSRISRLLTALCEYAALHKDDFHGIIAKGAILDGIIALAGSFESRAGNTSRAVIRKDQPFEALKVENKLYCDPEVGRGARNDRMHDEEAQGLVDFITGVVSPTKPYQDRRLPMLDLWCVVVWHPDWWITIFVLTLVIWLNCVRPKYVVLGAAKLLNLAERRHFVNIFSSSDPEYVERVLSAAFSQDGDIFSTELLDSLLADPTSVASPVVNDDDEKLRKKSLRGIEEWEELTGFSYLLEVGRPRVAKLGPTNKSYYVIIPVIHCGAHAYRGLTRAFTIRLSQACQLVIDHVEHITANKRVDGTQVQAEAILAEVQQLLKQTGMTVVLEQIRSEALGICEPLSALEHLGRAARSSRHDSAPEQRERRSEGMSRTIQDWDQKSLKALGPVGSELRLKQVLSIIQQNRLLLNDKQLVGLESCPKRIKEGPGSLQAFFWFALEVQEGASYGRAANGTDSLQTNITSDISDLRTLEATILQTRTARKKIGSTGGMTPAEMYDFLVKRPNAGSVRQLKCLECGLVEYQNPAKQAHKYRHLCTVNVKSEDLLDLDDLDRQADELAKAKGVTRTGTNSGDKPRASGRRSSEETIEAWLPSDSTGSSQKWVSIEEDTALQKAFVDIKAGILHKNRVRKHNPSEKHGRYSIADMESSNMKREQALVFLNAIRHLRF